MGEDVAKYSASTIAEMNNGIILANFEKDLKVRETSYQSEAELERNLISNLISQGYERLFVKSNKDLYKNLKIQLEKLNNISFSSSEWERFLQEYLDCPNEGMVEKTRKIQKIIFMILFLMMERQKISKLLTRKIFTIIFCKLPTKFVEKVSAIIAMMLQFWSMAFLLFILSLKKEG